MRALVLEPLARSDRSRRGRGTRRRSSWGGRASSEWAEALRRRLITRLLARRRGGRRLSGAYRAVRVALAIGASGHLLQSAVCSVHSFPKYQRIAHFTTCRRTRAHAQHVVCKKIVRGNVFVVFDDVTRASLPAAALSRKRAHPACQEEAAARVPVHRGGGVGASNGARLGQSCAGDARDAAARGSQACSWPHMCGTRCVPAAVPRQNPPSAICYRARALAQRWCATPGLSATRRALEAWAC